MGFGRYVLHRLLLVVPTLFGVTLISFTLVYVLPGNPALVKAGSLATPEHVAAIERQMGLDRPVHVQYWRYLTGLLRADLGESSSTGRPVLEDFRQRVPATLELTLASLLVAAAIGIPLGVLSAVHRDTALDHASRLVGVGGVAMPSFWTGLLLLYVFFYLLGVAPPPLGRIAADVVPPTRLTGLYVIDAALTGHGTALLSALHHLMLPALTLGFAVMAPLTRMVRATMLEILESDCVNAAWAAGLPRRRVIYGDALRNALIPVITLLFVAPARAKPPRFTGRAAGPVGPPEDPGPARENGGRRGGRWCAGYRLRYERLGSSRSCSAEPVWMTRGVRRSGRGIQFAGY